MPIVTNPAALQHQGNSDLKSEREEEKKSGRRRLPAPLGYSLLWWRWRASVFLSSCGGIFGGRGRSLRRSPGPATQTLEITQTLFYPVAPEKTPPPPATTTAEVPRGSQGAIIAPCLLSFFCFAAAAARKIPPVGRKIRSGGLESRICQQKIAGIMQKPFRSHFFDSFLHKHCLWTIMCIHMICRIGVRLMRHNPRNESIYDA